MRILRRYCVDHDIEAVFGSWKLGLVVLGVSATDVLLDGAKSFFLVKISN